MIGILKADSTAVGPFQFHTDLGIPEEFMLCKGPALLGLGLQPSILLQGKEASDREKWEDPGVLALP